MRKFYLLLLALCCSARMWAGGGFTGLKAITAIGDAASEISTGTTSSSDGTWYVIYNAGRSKYWYENSESNVMHDTSPLNFIGPNANKYLFQFVPVAGQEGQYYIKSASGKYVMNCQASTQVKTAEEGALPFTVYTSTSGTNCWIIKNVANSVNMNGNDGNVVGWGTDEQPGGNSNLQIMPATLVDAYDITLNYQWKSTTQFTKHEYVKSGEDYTITVPTYYGATGTATPASCTGVTENKTVDINYTESSSETIPFTATTVSAGAFAEGTKWYNVKLQASYLYYVESGDEFIQKSSKDVQDVDLFAFTGNPVAGYNFYNKAVGASKVIYKNSPTDTDDHIGTTASANGTWFIGKSTSSTTGYTMRESVTENAYANSRNSGLAFWINGAAVSGDGSSLNFEEADLSSIYSVTYIYKLDGTELGRVTKKTTSATPAAIDANYRYLDVTYADEDGTTITLPSTVSADRTFTVNTSYNSLFKLPVSTNTTTGATWKRVKVNGLDMYVDGTTIYTKSGSTPALLTQDNYNWCFTGDWYNGFQIYNRGTQKYVSLATTSTNNEIASLGNSVNLFEMTMASANDDNFFFRVKGTANNYIGDHKSSQLATWNSTGNLADNSNVGSVNSKWSIAEAAEVDGFIRMYNAGRKAANAENGEWYVSGTTVNKDGQTGWDYNSTLLYYTGHKLMQASTGKYLKASGTTRSGSYGSDADYSLVDNAATATEFIIIPTTTVSGAYNIANASGSGELCEWGGSSSNKLFSNDRSKKDSWACWTISEIDSETVTVGSAGYATYAPSYDVLIPTNAEVYSASYNGSSATLNAASTALKASEGVILKNAGTYKFVKTTEEVSAIEGNDLVGVTAATALSNPAGKQIYILANHATNGVGFYKWDGSETQLAANKAYLVINAGGSVKEFVGFGSDETAITNIEVVPTHDGKYLENGKIMIIKNGKKYNVAGQMMK